MPPIYLDHAATTRLDDEVLEAMLPYLKQDYGNASSVHALGRRARVAIERSRERIAACIGAEPSEVIFTSGGTESNNTAICGSLQRERPHVITSAVEHEAVLRPVEARRERGWRATVLKPDRSGAVTAEQVQEALVEDAGLVSIMFVNNETGAVSPIRRIAESCRTRGVPLHCDAVQAAGYYALQVDELGVDLMTLSAHKIYGPKGAGVLYVRNDVALNPLLIGGAQERRQRAGTENVAAIVGMAAALDRATAVYAERARQVGALRDRMRGALTEALGGTFVCNTPPEAAPHILNIAFPPVDDRPLDGEMLLLSLDVEGVMASSGSACTSGAIQPSHVLTAMGLSPATASAAIRFSLGKDNTTDEVDAAVAGLVRVVGRMRGR